jgi:hypothetical protein
VRFRGKGRDRVDRGPNFVSIDDPRRFNFISVLARSSMEAVQELPDFYAAEEIEGTLGC